MYWDQEAALKRLNGNRQLLSKILLIFEEGVHERLALIETAITENDHEQLRQAAHALKGSAGEIGAEQLQAELAELEFAARNQSSELYPILLPQIQETALKTLLVVHVE